jgi:hypothetical protein
VNLVGMAVQLTGHKCVIAIALVSVFASVQCSSVEIHAHSRKLMQTFDPSFPFLLILSLAFLGIISCLFQFRHILFSMKAYATIAKTPFTSDFSVAYNSVP